ncbi:PQQ-dependent sugar dehydrogenase [Escherichia coli]
MSFFRSLGGSCNGKCRSTASQTDSPWALAFLPDDHGMLITLRGGELRHWQQERIICAAFRSSGRWAHGQGGLLDVVLAPDFARLAAYWLSSSEVGDDGKAGTAVGYGRLR